MIKNKQTNQQKVMPRFLDSDSLFERNEARLWTFSFFLFEFNFACFFLVVLVVVFDN